MSWLLSHPFISLCYAFLYLSVILLWFPGEAKFPRWSYALLASIVLGLLTKQLQVGALICIVLLALSAYYSQRPKTNSWLRALAIMVVLVLSVGLATHQLPGFNNLLVLDHVYLSPDALPYTLYLNFDKTLIGIFILGLGCSLIEKKSQWYPLFKKILPMIVVLILTVTDLAFILGYVRFDPKFPSCFFIWASANLFFVCLAEEAFFRGFIQKKLALLMKENQLGNYLALIVAAFLFGFSHQAGGLKYVALATLAGLGYGYIYQRTKRIEASIVAHFSLNLVHFLFFTYPALATAL